MIKNLNDLLSLIVLVLIFVYFLRIFIWSQIKKGKNESISIDRWQLIKDYIDNEEE